MRSNYSRFKAVYKDIYNDLYNLILLLDFDYRNAKKLVPDNIKSYVNKKIREWKDNGLGNDYFAYLVNNFNSYTYLNVLELLVYGLYYESSKNLYSMMTPMFYSIAEDTYAQVKDEAPNGFSLKPLSWSLIDDALFIITANCTFKEYLKALLLTNAQDTFKLIVINSQKSHFSLPSLKNIINKQLKNLISINDKKFSGVLDMACRSEVNNLYISLLSTNYVRFIAEEDDRTTKMCRSLDGQVFAVDDWNEFTRYSDDSGGYVSYRVFGLERGVNLPPIEDHFHWCRSTITFNK